MVTFDRDSKNHGLLILPNGGTYDVYGDSVEELKTEAMHIAKLIDVEIDVWNWELPES